MRGATVLTVLPTSCHEVVVAASADDECMARLRVANEAVFLDSMTTYASLRVLGYDFPGVLQPEVCETTFSITPDVDVVVKVVQPYCS